MNDAGAVVIHGPFPPSGEPSITVPGPDWATEYYYPTSPVASGEFNPPYNFERAVKLTYLGNRNIWIIYGSGGP